MSVIGLDMSTPQVAETEPAIGYCPPTVSELLEIRKEYFCP